MVTDDSLPWRGPVCPHCGTELDVEPLAAAHTIRVTYRCQVHGIISVADPFEEV